MLVERDKHIWVSGLSGCERLKDGVDVFSQLVVTNIADTRTLQRKTVVDTVAGHVLK